MIDVRNDPPVNRTFQLRQSQWESLIRLAEHVGARNKKGPGAGGPSLLVLLKQLSQWDEHITPTPLDEFICTYFGLEETIKL